MKKTIAVFLVILLSACSSKEPIEKYLKEDIVVETNAKVTLNEVVEVDKLKDDKLKESLEKAEYKIDYKENKLIDKKDIKEDKIFATNKLNISYNYKDKDYTKELDIKIKDSKAPQVTIKHDTLYYSLGSKVSKEQVIKDIAPSIKDNGKYTSELVDYDSINFNKAGTYPIELKVSDEAMNVVSKKINLKIEDNTLRIKVPLANCCGLKAKNITFTFPGEISSQYKIYKSTIGDMTDGIIIENNNEKYIISVPTPYQIGFPQFKRVEEYKRNNYNVSLMRGEKEKNVGLASVYSLKYDNVGFVVTMNKKKGNFKEMVNTIVDNVNIK